MMRKSLIFSVISATVLSFAVWEAHAVSCNGHMLERAGSFEPIHCQSDGGAIGYRNSKGGSLFVATWDAEGNLLSVDRTSPRLVPLAARSNFKKQCPKTSELSGTLIYKSLASSHITGGDPRAASTSWIGKFGAPSMGSSCLSGIGKDGNTYHKFGYYGRWLGGPWRYYGGHGCGTKESASRLAANLQRATKSTEMWVKNGSLCYRIPNVRNCYNSSGC